jgi:hypothetical protein
MHGDIEVKDHESYALTVDWWQTIVEYDGRDLG